MSFTVGTYNMGSSAADLRSYYPAGYNRGNTHYTNEVLEAELARVRRLSAERIAGAAEVFCLQEVGDTNRPELQSLRASGFTIHGCETLKENPDVAIAIKAAQFERVENLSFFTEQRADVAMVRATFRETGQRFLFLSGHITGFNIEEEERRHLLDSEENGRLDCREIATRVEALASSVDYAILGADMNAIPEMLPVDFSHRFKVLEKAGFRLYRSGKPTALTTNPAFAKKVRWRELDYFALRPTRPRSEKELCISFTQTAFSPGLDPAENPSDHAPIYVRIEANSWWPRFASWLSGFVSSP